MEHQTDEFKAIAEQQIAYFGGPGQMLLPSRATVEAFIQKIPPGKLVTTDLLRTALARQFGVQGTCPVTTRKVLRLIANDSHNALAYWRVIKQNGELMAYYPGAVSGHADLLQREGFSIDSQGKTHKVSNFKASLMQVAG